MYATTYSCNKENVENSVESLTTKLQVEKLLCYPSTIQWVFKFPKSLCKKSDSIVKIIW